MLTNLKKIKSLGVFDDYAASADLPAFGRYNIVYGENGSGKTTLSRLLGCLQTGSHPDHPKLEYLIESQSGQLTQAVAYQRRVRVFNSDYVEANIGRVDGPLRHILILGEENKALSEELKKEVVTLEARKTRIEAIGTLCARLEGDRGKQFSQIAKTISEATSGAALRSYRKPDAEGAFAKMVATELLSDETLGTHRSTVRQEQLPQIGPLKTPSVIEADGERSLLAIAEGSAARAKSLISKSAQSATIARLVQNPAIASWVEEGLHIHSPSDHGKCEFCDQVIPSDRLKTLADHFSEEDQKLKAALDAERSSLRKVLDAFSTFSLPDQLAFYSELRSDYTAATSSFLKEFEILKSNIENIDQELAKKLTLRTSVYDVDVSSDTTRTEHVLTSINAVTKRHDDKTASFENEKSIARDAIERHYLFSIKDQVDHINAQIDALRAEGRLLQDGGQDLDDQRSLSALSQSVLEKQAQVLNAHIGGADLTKHLKQFLGRTDLKFESSNEGYLVLRRGKPAKRLSEGERTAIAFLYFLVQLKDQDFQLSEGVVVIDDPISSLDASAIYQAFSFLKNEAQAAKQLFILTHNFEFLRLLINWLKHMHGVPKADRTHTMVLCSETESGRFAKLVRLDNLLLEHATEYHYLFKVLLTFKSDGTILGCYHIPNVARKVLETFLDFHIPSNKNLYQKLEEITFDPHKKTAINKFANDLSHHTGKGFDPALVAETQKNAAYLLEMIETVAPLHYKGLKNLAEA